MKINGYTCKELIDALQSAEMMISSTIQPLYGSSINTKLQVVEEIVGMHFEMLNKEEQQ